MIQVFSLSQREQWDEIVKSFEQHDVYWLSGYVMAFRHRGEGDPLLLYYQGESVRGINVVLKRDVAEDKHFAGQLPEGVYFDLTTPYGYGGWLIEGENGEELFSSYETWCRDNGIICEFVRFHPVIDNQSVAQGAYQVIPLGQTVMLHLDSPEQIWSDISSKNRNMIRKAEKSGIAIHTGNSKELFGVFTDIYNQTMDKNQADDYYYFDEPFYDSIREDLANNATIFYAKKDEKIIAASIIIYQNGFVNYHLSGSLLEYRNLAPSNLLLYKVALWGQEKGYRTFHLGGGVGSAEDSLFKFKRAFVKEDGLCRFCIGKKVFCQEKYDHLVALRGEIQRNFFPLYRA